MLTASSSVLPTVRARSTCANPPVFFLQSRVSPSQQPGVHLHHRLRYGCVPEHPCGGVEGVTRDADGSVWVLTWIEAVIDAPLCYLASNTPPSGCWSCPVFVPNTHNHTQNTHAHTKVPHVWCALCISADGGFRFAPTCRAWQLACVSSVHHARLTTEHLAPGMKGLNEAGLPCKLPVPGTERGRGWRAKDDGGERERERESAHVCDAALTTPCCWRRCSLRTCEAGPCANHLRSSSLNFPCTFL